MGIKMKQNKEILVYGTSWCGDTKRACVFLEDHNIEYRFVDIDKDRNGERIVRKINEGSRSVPTIIFLDGSILVEPDSQTLAEKVGIF
jgi:mycoredoxin